MWKKSIKEELFGCFYIHFCKEAIQRWKQIAQKYAVYENEISESILVQNCYHRISELPLRVLIADMQSCQENNTLNGTDSIQKYIDYNQRLLGSEEYIHTLEKKYPELFRLLNLRVNQSVIQMCEIISAVNRDNEELFRGLCHNEKFRGVSDIQLGLSDSHNGGKTVARVVLDNGVTVIYKPRELKTEERYQKIFNDFCKGCGVKGFLLRCIDRKNYGWESFLEFQECGNEEEVKKYYFRCGIHAFLTWVLGATDLHGENVLAIGEFPVILDMETIPGGHSIKNDLNIDRYVEELIQNSVLKTGIFPTPIFENLGGTCFNALHSPGKQKVKLKAPFIENIKTVDMKIGYQEVEIELSESLPVLNGVSVGPVEYTEIICEGFKQANQFYLANKGEIDKRFEEFYKERFRIVRRNTQQYAMLQSISLHPNFVENSNTRREILQKLRTWDKQVSKEEEKMQDYEIETLFNLDIPIFYGQGESNRIYVGCSKEGIEVFDNTPLDGFKLSVQAVERNFQYQIWLMKTSLSGLRVAKENTEVLGLAAPDKNQIDILIKKIADQICDNAVMSLSEEISWIGIWKENIGQWRYGPVDLYLYDGMAGIAVFMAEIVKKYHSKKYEEVYYLILKRMFNYTHLVTKEPDQIKTKRTGALTGESSVVLSYILQYEISKDQKFLKMAEEHTTVLVKKWREDTSFDFTSGNAGLIYVMMRLYECTFNRKYLLFAVEVGDWLWEKKVRTPWGCGWLIGNESLPLTGMAHGNSGFIVAYAQLLKYTQDKEYELMIRELLRYENHFYSEHILNWLDLRGCVSGESNAEQGRTTWCHGAPGVLLSRLYLQELNEFRDDYEVKRDIDRALEKLLHVNYTGGICLCHGRAGNEMILKICEQKNGGNKQVKEEMIHLIEEIVEVLEERRECNVEERFHPGLMNGITGVGMMLINSEESFLSLNI